MSFHLGKPILVMLVLATLSGVALRLLRKETPRGDLQLWCFAESHWRAFMGDGLPPGEPTPADQFLADTGKTVDMLLIQHRAFNTRLSTMFMSGTGWPELPDLVEIEIGSVGRYFRPPVDEVGFLPLNDLIERNNWSEQIVESRFMPWSKTDPTNGKRIIFGIPHDIHPVMIAYNTKWFEEAGVDLPACRTWAEFHTACLRYRDFWRARGEVRRWPVELPSSNAGTLITMLLQRGINVVDDENRVYLTDSRVLDTLLMYVRMVEGPDRIGAATAAGDHAYSQDFSSQFVASMFCADWRLRYVKDYAPALRGQIRVMPLPRFEDSQCRTSTIGGTMIAIPRNSRNPELAWKLIEQLYLKPEGLTRTIESSFILPSSKAAWTHPINEEPDEYYGGQQVRKLIVDLADEVPARLVSPASMIAEGELALALIDAIEYFQSHGETGFEEHTRQLLEAAARRVERRIEHGDFDQKPGEGTAR
jgi:arabinosaccharide transport system substrate-binding protein